MTSDRKERPRGDGDLPPLPPLDDDGEPLGDDDPFEGPFGGASDVGSIPHDGPDDGHDPLDDRTGEGEPLDRWGVDGGLGTSLASSISFISFDEHERGLLADSEPHGDAAYDGADEIVAGSERGLLEGSDEGDGRDVTADEAGLFDDDRSGDHDDGGAEGTGEDPALAIDEVTALDPRALDAPPDEEGVDDLAVENDDAARLRASFEREPWPRRADRAWAVSLLDRGRDRASDPDDVRGSMVGRSPSEIEVVDRLSLGPEAWVLSGGEVVVAASAGEAVCLSTDGGVRFDRVAGCSAVTAIALVPSAPGGRAVVVALFDVGRDLAALATIRIVDGVALAELVAELPSPDHSGEDVGEDDDDLGRVESLRVRTRADGAIDVVARGRFGAVRARG